MAYKVILKFKDKPVKEIESIELNTREEAEDTAEKGKVLYQADSYEIVPVGEEQPERSCYDCRFYNAEQSICDWNYRATCIRDESESARDCKEYEKGTFIDSDENLLVD